MNNSKLYFAGGDNRGLLFDDGNFVRRVCNCIDSYPQEIYDAYCIYKLAEYGVIQTSYYPDIKTFYHPKMKISYPYEWPPSLFKDVVLFHVELLVHINRYGLTLKDALPENVLLDGVRPILVDFFSIVKKENLSYEKWLMDGAPSNIDPTLRVLQLMFVPHMLLPLIMYARKDFMKGHRLLSEYYCNNINRNKATWACVPELNIKGRIIHICKSIKSRLPVFSQIELFSELHSLCYDPLITWSERLDRLRVAIESCNVSPCLSGYSSYYEDKNEYYGLSDLNRWTDKQNTIYQLLSTIQPKTVLDIGSNTGWFSKLACSLGASVIAIDADLKSIDILYRESKFCYLKLTPLCLKFDDLIVEHYSLDKCGLKQENPFHIAAIKRFKSEVVLCLGLLHHLTLGMGKNFKNVIEVLALLTSNTLVLEYVSLSDPLIESNPGFFAKIDEWSYEAYSRDLLIKVASEYFEKCTILPSNPKTRSLLVFSR